MATKSGKRELIDTGTDKRYVKREESGRFKEVVDVGRLRPRTIIKRWFLMRSWASLLPI